MNQRQGLYVSYNEDKNGPFDEAVEISKTRGCVTWLDSFKLNPKQLHYPTDIFIRLTGPQERYFKGTLLAIAPRETLPANFLDGERNHRPPVWQQRDHAKGDFKSVLFISHLQRLDSQPLEVKNSAPPQHPTYVDL